MNRAVGIFVLIVLSLLLVAAPALVSAQPAGVSVTCDNGASFDNGVEIIVNQMRSGFTYTATAIGINGFDPVLAVLDETGEGLCSDDDSGAAQYSADLPTTGSVRASGLNAQVRFSQNSASAFADVSLVVGGFGNQTGEFVLILEGMGVTQADNIGDPFSVGITPQMVASGVPLTVYMMARGGVGLDPLIYLADPSSLGTIATDDRNQQIRCDDAGNPNLCYGSSSSLNNSSVTIATGTLRSDQFDAMLGLSLDGLQLSSVPDENILTYVMTSFQRQTQGQYLLAFHVGTAEAVGGAGGDSKATVGQPTAVPTRVPTTPPQVADGVSVTCDNGARFDNGVEFTVVQMRSGFTYTATALGIGGFDPVLAVLDESGEGLCSDDDVNASSYRATLPTTGGVNGNSFSSRVRFDQNSASAFADVSLVVGGFGNQRGEFVLILEGMGVTQADNVGDPFAVRLTQGMVNSGVPLTVYMIGASASLDPLTYLSFDGDVAVDDFGDEVLCDDAGNASLC
ncbi:MAG: hypothetical protein GYB67_03725, partial [Chloroflexi bacterium]|nr:hypothetical protein [Chloroflexota bacterium]